MSGMMDSVGFSDQALESDSCGLLLGLLFSGAFGFGESPRAPGFVVDANFDTESLLVIGTGLVGEDVTRLSKAGSLEMFLKGRFVVADGSREGIARLHGEVKVGQGWLDDVLIDKSAGGFETTVEVESGNNGFECVGEDGGLGAASALFFAAAKAEETAKINAEGDLSEMAATDKRGTETREFALTGRGEAVKEGLGHGETEYGVAYKLKLLIIRGRRREGLGIGFVSERTVGECP
jgi:hypothetical protein